jgi:hypothetical protein
MEKSLSENNQVLPNSLMEKGYVFCADLLGFKKIIENLSAHEDKGVLRPNAPFL